MVSTIPWAGVSKEVHWIKMLGSGIPRRIPAVPFVPVEVSKTKLPLSAWRSLPR
jgi:hypothetical protein